MKSDYSRTRVYRSPQVLSALVQGKDRGLGNMVGISLWDVPAKAQGYMDFASLNDRSVSGFSAIDFSFVVGTLLTLMVVFLAYDSVAGEKDRGTLRLVHANAVPRHALLLGKFLGGVTVVLLTLLLAFVGSLIVLVAHPAVSLCSSDWCRLLWLLGASALYLTCMFSLGLCVSVMVNHPSTALTVLLQVWVVANVIYPNLAAAAAERLYALPTERDIAAQKSAAIASFEGEWKKTVDEFVAIVNSARDVPKDLNVRMYELTSRRTEAQRVVDAGYAKQLAHQAHLARVLALFSPVSLYDQIATRAARTDMEEYERFMQGVAQCWRLVADRGRRCAADPREYRNTKSPELSYTSESATRGFTATLPQAALLALMTAMLFMVAYMRFLRKDVR
jgi:hypothetical protein